MKIQNLAVIFILIIMPITIVFSEYISNQVKTVELQNIYDARLLDSTYDAIKAFQLNTVNNNLSGRPDSKIESLEAAVNTFFNSLITSFEQRGNKKSIMKEYVPAVVFSMYDGYYVYSPYINTLTNAKDEHGNPELDKVSGIEDDYQDTITLNGLKPYVYYNCRYIMGNNGRNDFIITYTLDNYITVNGMVDGNYVNRSGYLMEGITKSGNSYIYQGITFSNTNTEEMKEYYGEKEYSYVKINGTKYYYNDVSPAGPSDNDYIFYIDASGEIKKEVNNRKGSNIPKFDAYYNAIKKNKSAYTYYRDAYEFTNWVRTNLGALTTNDAQVDEEKADFKKASNNRQVFNFGTTNNLVQYSNSFFNVHRKEIIRYVIETNLSTAITGFSKYSNSNQAVFMMPKISETDWELLENNICVATFLQGMSIGGKVYNGYSVVPNNLTKEYVDEEDIYILKNNNTYCKVNDTTITNSFKTSLGYQPGVFKINFERRSYLDGNDTKYYYPLQFVYGTNKKASYLGSYTSIVGSTAIDSIAYTDMYRYLLGRTDNPTGLKRVYYTALARERMSIYNVNNYTGTTAIMENANHNKKLNLENWYYLTEYMPTWIEDPG